MTNCMLVTPTQTFTSVGICSKVPAWYYSIARGTGAIFTLPHKMLNSYASLSFCTWYFMANKVPGFGINTSYIKGIKSMYKAKVGSKGYRM